MDVRGGGWAVFYENNQLWNFITVPGFCIWCTEDGNVLAEVDAFASSLAVGARFGRFGLFYSAGVTGTFIPGSTLFGYAGESLLVPAYSAMPLSRC